MEREPLTPHLISLHDLKSRKFRIKTGRLLYNQDNKCIGSYGGYKPFPDKVTRFHMVGSGDKMRNVDPRKTFVRNFISLEEMITRRNVRELSKETKNKPTPKQLLDRLT